MQFKPELAEKILKGEKAQTRRIVKPGYWLVTYPDGRKAVIDANDGRIKWKTGQTYAIQPGRGKVSLGRFRLLDIRKESLQDISVEDIKAEGIDYTDAPGLIHRGDGYAYMQAWKWTWDSINYAPGQRWEDNPEVWVLIFELQEQLKPTQ